MAMPLIYIDFLHLGSSALAYGFLSNKGHGVPLYQIILIGLLLILIFSSCAFGLSMAMNDLQLFYVFLGTIFSRSISVFLSTEDVATVNLSVITISILMLFLSIIITFALDLGEGSTAGILSPDYLAKTYPELLVNKFFKPKAIPIMLFYSLFMIVVQLYTSRQSWKDELVLSQDSESVIYFRVHDESKLPELKRWLKERNWKLGLFSLNGVRWAQKTKKDGPTKENVTSNDQFLNWAYIVNEEELNQ